MLLNEEMAMVGIEEGGAGDVLPATTAQSPRYVAAFSTQSRPAHWLFCSAMRFSGRSCRLGRCR